MSDTLSEVLGLLSTGIKNPLKNNYQYEPHKKQKKFHKAEHNGRQYIGGNRSGKTTGGINEDIWWLTGRHPYLKLPPPPLFGRLCTVDFKNGWSQIVRPVLKQWLPPSDLVNGSWEDSYDKKEDVLTLANGSQMEIRSYDQDLDKFAGVPRHFIHFDEEPPFDIFKECKARLVDYRGRWWMTMTPVEGMTWTYDEVYTKDSRLIKVVTVDIHDNPHLSPEAIEELLEGYDENERQIRGKGRYIAISGLIFKYFMPALHVIPSGTPQGKDWTHYKSLDAGFNNPTAVYWHAVNNKTGVVVTYKEHYRREWTVEQHATHIKTVDAQLDEEHGIKNFLSVADPAIKQRQQTTGHSVQIEYALNGLNWATNTDNRDVSAGLDKMNNYLRLGKWFITEDCPNLIREMRKYRWEEYSTSKTREKNNKKEVPLKKDDHGCDSCRYFFGFAPYLSYDLPTPDVFEPPNLLGAPTIRLDRPLHVDTNLQQTDSGIYIVHDEYVGEY